MASVGGAFTEINLMSAKQRFESHRVLFDSRPPLTLPFGHLRQCLEPASEGAHQVIVGFSKLQEP